MGLSSLILAGKTSLNFSSSTELISLGILRFLFKNSLQDKSTLQIMNLEGNENSSNSNYASVNRPFPSYLVIVPLFQNEFTCKTFL